MIYLAQLTLLILSFTRKSETKNEIIMSTKEQLLDALDNSRESLLMAIEPLPDEALVEKQAVGEWSVSDVLINITAWEAELVTGLMRIQQNKRPEKLLDALMDPDKYDEKRYTENQDRDLDQVFMDLQQVRVQVEEWILEFTDRELDNPKRYHWLNGKPLRKIITTMTTEREKKVIPLLQLYAQQWSLLTMDDEIIPLQMLRLDGQENNHDNSN